MGRANAAAGSRGRRAHQELSRSESSERALLASVLLRPEVLPGLLREVELEHFYSERHQHIWQALDCLAIEGEEINLRTIQAKLEDAGHFEHVGGLAYLAGLDLDLPNCSDAALKGYVRIVLDRYARRSLSLLGTRLAQAAGTGGEDTVELLKLAETELERLDTLRGTKTPPYMSALDLLAMDLPEPGPVVDGLISEGLTVIAGKPKLGKSILSLDLAASIAAGKPAVGGFPSHQGKALYVALEDGPRRLRSRIERSLTDCPADFDIATEWPLIGRGGIAELERYIVEQQPRCIIIDTLIRIRRKKRSQDRYEADYESLAELQQLATRRRLAIIVIHHTNKADGSDFLDAVSGSTGLTAATDSVAVLTRARGEADGLLEITGRDIEEKSFALQFDGEALSWSLLGDGREYAMSKERREILEHLRELGPDERSWPKGIAEALGRPEKSESVRKLCVKLVGENLVDRDDRGYFASTTGG